MWINVYRFIDEDCIDISTASHHLIELEFRPLQYWRGYWRQFPGYHDGSSYYLELGFVKIGVQYRE